MKYRISSFLFVFIMFFSATSFAQANAAPTVTSITPNVGNDTGPAYITDLAGTNFQDPAMVKLMKSGETDILATNVTVDSAERIICEFDLSSADDGYWDVYVENPDGQSATLADGFQVTQGATIPSILFRKSGPAEGSIGDTVTYGFTVSNTGNVPLQNVVIQDSMLDNITIGWLAVTETVTRYLTYTILASDPNPLVNNATATGYDSDGTKVTDENAHSIDIVPEVLDLIKSGPAIAKNGETITYTFNVHNLGADDLNNGLVTDSLLGAGWSWDFGTLAPGETKTSTATYTITDADTLPITNTATATAFDADSLEVKDEDTWVVSDSTGTGSCTASQLVPGGAKPADVLLVFAICMIPIASIGIQRLRRRKTC